MNECKTKLRGMKKSKIIKKHMNENSALFFFAPYSTNIPHSFTLS